MLQSEQATEDDRAQQVQGIQQQGRMALSAAAMVSEQMRQQQENVRRSMETQARMTEIHLKNQHLQQQMASYEGMLRLKTMAAQAQMASAQARQARAATEERQERRLSLDLYGGVMDVGGKQVTMDPFTGGPKEVSKEEAEKIRRNWNVRRSGSEGPSLERSFPKTLEGEEVDDSYRSYMKSVEDTDIPKEMVKSRTQFAWDMFARGKLSEEQIDQRINELLKSGNVGRQSLYDIRVMAIRDLLLKAGYTL